MLTNKIDGALGDRSDRLDRLDLRPRKAEPRELCRSREPDRVVMERIERRKHSVADRGRARSRKLLPADDGAEA
jgi:hypothetical protein